MAEGAAKPEEGANRQLEWYRDSTKWLVATSGAAIVLGLGWVVDGKFDIVGRAMFSAAGLALLASSGFGILAIFKMADYESSRSAKNDGERLKKDRRAANAWFKRTFTLFFIGLALLVLAGAWLIWSGKGSDTDSARFRVLKYYDEPNVIGILLDSKSDAIWLIRQDPASAAITIEQSP